jgi:hypothetical protein
MRGRVIGVVPGVKAPADEHDVPVDSDAGLALGRLEVLHVRVPEIRDVAQIGGISHYEWLCNLESLLWRGEFQFQGIPLNLKGGSGSPVRALAFVD